MDVVLGVAVTGRVARLAMVDSPGTQVLDQYAFDLTDDALTELAETIIGTYREVADSGNRVAATRLCLPDADQAQTLRQTVAGAGVQNVDVVTEAEAAASLARSQGVDAALLVAQDDTVSLTVAGDDPGAPAILASMPIGAAGAAVACATVLRQAPPQTRVMLTGQRLDLDSIAAELRSTAPVEVAPDAGYAIARGAAYTADGAGAATQLAPAVDATQAAPVVDATQAAPVVDATQAAPVSSANTELAPQLAYSQAPDDEPWPGYGEMPEAALAEFVPEQEDAVTSTGSDLTGSDFTTAIPAPPPRLILMGSAVSFLVVSFATLAVTVAVNIRPAAVVSAQPAPVQSDTVPGRYLPPVPHAPDPVALPVAVLTPPPAAPAAPARSATVGPPAATPAPQAPPPVEVPPAAPPPAGVPAVPIPIPPVIVFPPLTPWTPPTVTTTPTTTTPTTTVPTTTTTSAPPTTTTTSAPPATSTAPTTTNPPTTTSEPPPAEPVTPVQPVTPVAPVEQAPATQAPPVTKAPPSDESPSGGSSHGDGSGGSRHSGQAPATTVSESP